MSQYPSSRTHKYLDPKVVDMRQAVAGAYSGKNWYARVMKMPSNQITAIYHRFIRDGVIK